MTATAPGTVSLYTEILYDGTQYVSHSAYYTFPIIPQQGTYFIQNAGTDKYMDVEGASTASGAIIQQWAYHTGNQAKFVIEHVSGQQGYCRIKSVHSNLYVGVDSTNTSVIRQYSTLNDYTLWKIESTTTDVARRLKFTCKATESSGLVLSVPSVTSGDGVDLTQNTYVNDTNICDEWIALFVRYGAVVNAFYDHGYHVRYGETEAVSREKITQYNLAVSERYLELFGLVIQVNTPQYFNSAIDNCKGTVSSNNIDTLCSHSSGIIHTDRGSIINDFYSQHAGNNTTTSELWTCHKIKSIASDGNVNYNRSCSWYSSIYVLAIDYTESERAQDSVGVLMHELAHQYGVTDHYHENDENGNCKFPDKCSQCTGNTETMNCVMVDPYDTIDREDVMCDACKQEMITHLEKHH